MSEPRRAGEEAVETFASLVPNILIRRHEDSRWFGDHLIELEPLYQKKVTVHFPTEYRTAYDSMIRDWKSKQMNVLEAKQAAWESKKNEKGFLDKYPEPPTALDENSVSSQARLLRVCSDIPYLAVVALGSGMRETNESVLTDCMDIATGRMKVGCLLDDSYKNPIRTCPRLSAIEQILALNDHNQSSTLILSSFSKMTLIVGRVSRCLGVLEHRATG